ncbi:ABC transporter permease subunit [Haloplanus halophilus]|uniref:ABC transporter permease subunit n=1 Tax=Haloplanus halophilus TaxID=2949993 RepID=UPI00203ACB1F|nr:ABC transporter permease subunit [Haloplanus sp. GDY1]
MTGPLGAFWAVFAREVRAASRSPTYALLGLAVTLVVFGVALAGDGPSAGYVPTVVDVLLIVEVLVPAVAFAVGYRAVADDAERGRLEVLATYPLPAPSYVGGVYAGRAVALLAVVLVPLAALGLHVATTAAPSTTVFATHRGVDSPLLFVRFLALTAALALVALALAVALSSVAGSRRRAILLALVGLLVVVVGADVAVFGAVTGDVGVGLDALLALSPSSAYRGLVFETVLYVAFTGRSAFVSVPAAVGSLCVWGVGSLAVATLAVRTGRR